MRQGKARYVFPGSNTPLGFYSYYKEGLSGLEQIFILKGGPGTGKSTLMRKIGTAMLDRGFDVEFWQCSSDNDSLDGVLIPNLSVGIVDGTAPHTLDPAYPGAVEEIINLGDHWDTTYLRQHKNDIITCSRAIQENFQQSYEILANLGELRDKRTKLYASLVDQEKLSNAAEKLTSYIFNKKKTVTRHLFSSAVTPQGLVNLSESLSKDYERRYILRGMPGNGQDFIIDKLIVFAENYGQEMEIYHSTFDPEAVELLLFPDLSVAVIVEESSAPIDEKDNDIIIDMKDLLKNKLSDIDIENTLIIATNDLLQEAAKNVNTAKNIHDQMETYYIEAMDFEAVDFTASRLFNKILALAAVKD